MQQDYSALWERARAGDRDAQLQLARLDLEAGRGARALKWLRAAVAAGSAEAALVLGQEHRRGTRIGRDYAAARRALESAVRGDSPEAALELAEMDLAGLGDGPNPEAAANWLRRAVRAGQPRALEAMGFIHAMNGDQARADAAWSGVRLRPHRLAELADFAWPAPRAGDFDTETLSRRPHVKAVRGFMTRAECEYVMHKGAARLRPARVADPATGQAQVDGLRTGSDTGFGPDRLDVVLRLLEQRIAAVTEIPVENGEPLVLLHYAPGQEYRDHVDYLGRSEAESEREARFGGQRIMTFLVWLNEVSGGGETVFPRAGLRFRGRQGDALMFSNVRRTGEPDPETLHRGMPPVTGEKWLLSKWIRRHPHPR